MLGQVAFTCTNNPARLTVRRQAANFAGLIARPLTRAITVRSIPGQRQAGLATGHGQVNVGQDLGVEQGAVQLTARVVDTIAFAQRIEAVALARVTGPCHGQGI